MTTDNPTANLTVTVMAVYVTTTELEIYRLPLGLALQKSGLHSASSYHSLSQGAAINQNRKLGGGYVLSNQAEGVSNFHQTTIELEA